MSRYYVKMSNLSAGGEEVIKSVGLMNEEIDSINKSIDSLEWMGPAAEAYLELIKGKMKKTEQVSGLFNVFGKFMNKTSEGFTEVNDKTKKGFEDLQNNANSEVCSKCGSVLVNGICPVCSVSSDFQL